MLFLPRTKMQLLCLQAVPLQPLLVLVKAILKLHGLNDASKNGGLSSLGVIVMVRLTCSARYRW